MFIKMYRLFYSVPLGWHPCEPLTPFHFTGKSRICHVFPLALICMHEVFLNILSPCATLSRLRVWAESENMRYRHVHCSSVDLIFRLGFIREKSDFLMKFPTSGRSVDVSQEYIALCVRNYNNDFIYQLNIRNKSILYNLLDGWEMREALEQIFSVILSTIGHFV